MNKEKIIIILLIMIIILGFISYITAMIFAIVTRDRDLIAIGLFMGIVGVAISIASIIDRR